MAEKRNIVIVKQKFQQTVILQTILMTFFTLNIIVMIGFMDFEILNFTDNPKLSFAIIVSIFELIGFFVIYYFIRRLSFKTAGPIYVMERNIQKLTEGDLSFRMKLREGDHFQEFSDEINELTEVLRQRIGATQGYIESLEQEIQADTKAQEFVKLAREELSFFKLEEEKVTDKIEKQG